MQEHAIEMETRIVERKDLWKLLSQEFWDEEEELLFEILFVLISKAALKGAEKALAWLLADVGVGVDWGLVNEAVRRWAAAYTYDLVKGITETTRRFLQEAVADWMQRGAPLEELIKILEPMFGRTRAEMIAATEVTRAFAEGNLIAWKESGVVDGKIWMTAEDELVCPICSALGDMEPVALDADGFDGHGAPPAHVNCRCWLKPFVILPEKTG